MGIIQAESNVPLGVSWSALHVEPRIPVGILLPGRWLVYMALRAKKRVWPGWATLHKALMGCAEGSPPLLWRVLGLKQLDKAPACVGTLCCAVLHCAALHVVLHACVHAHILQSHVTDSHAVTLIRQLSINRSLRRHAHQASPRPNLPFVQSHSGFCLSLGHSILVHSLPGPLTQALRAVKWIGRASTSTGILLLDAYAMQAPPCPLYA